MLPVLPLVGGAILVTALFAADRSPRKRRRAPKASLGDRSRSWSRQRSAGGTHGHAIAAADAPARAGSDEDRRLRSNLTLSLSGLALATGASLFAPPFAWLSAPLLMVPILPFLRDGYRALVHERRLKMAVVDCVLMAGLAALGQWIALGVGVTMLSVARALIRRAEDRSQRHIIDIFGGQCRTVWVLVDGLEVEVPFERLAKDDVLVVGAGETIAADGVVTDGTGSVDQSVLTGEARPVEKGVGDAVSAATTVLSGKLRIRVERSGADTTAGKIAAALNQSADYRHQLQWRWMRTVDWMALPSLVSGAATWAAFGPLPALAMVYAVSGLGYAMRLVAPFLLFNALRNASVESLLVKDGRIFEQLQSIDTVVFDKTGTLTEERPQVGAVHGFLTASAERSLFLAASLEQRQSHPIAAAILDAATQRGLTTIDAENTRYAFGFGLQGRIDGEEVAIGSARFLELAGIPLPERSAAVIADSHARGHSLVWIAAAGAVIGAIELQPTIRPETHRIVRALRRRGLSVVILSGDHEEPTQYLGKLLGVDRAIAEVLPDEKAATLKALQADGRRVCFVGDGVNDSLALRQADVSVSLSGATTIATDTAEVVLMDRSLEALPTLFHLSDRFKDRMTSSLAVTGLPLAVGIGSVLVLHVGLVPVILLYYTGISLGIGHVGRPLLPSNRRRLERVPGTGQRRLSGTGPKRSGHGSGRATQTERNGSAGETSVPADQ